MKLGALKLSLDLYGSLIKHAHAALPMEAVGLLGGHPDGSATLAIPLLNLAVPRAFLADPLAQFKAERQLKQSGLHLLAIYHSHPGGGSQLSPEDIVFAQRWPCPQIVIALERPYQSGEEIRAYQVLRHDVTEVEIHIEGELS